MNQYLKSIFCAFISSSSLLIAGQSDMASIRAEIDQMKTLLPQKGTSLSDSAVGIELSGDFLYWKSNQDSIWMATLEGPPAFISGQNVFSNVRVLNQKFQFDPGFRIAASYFWWQNDWQSMLSWTRYRTSSSAQHTAATNELLMSSWGFASRVNLFTILDVAQTWKLHYDILDLTLISHNFNYQKISCQPTLGVRGAFIQQNIVQHLNVADLPPFFSDASGRFLGKNKFSGFGVLGSTALKYKIYGGLSLFSNLLGSLNYGRIKTVEDYAFFIDNGVPLTAYTPSEKIYRVRANAEIQGGLSWQRTFANGRTQFFWMVAYEQIIWFNMNFFKRYFSEEGAASTLQFAIVDLAGDLTLRGLTTRAGLDF